MKITIVAVGNLQFKYLNLLEEYIKKITFFSKINIIEIKEINETNINLKIQKETEKILESIPKNNYVILCSLSGKQYNSQEFVSFFDKSNITFVIGGSNGVDETKFENKICFSKMTFPHQLFRIFLVEQIYRAFSIKNNIKYHK
ncbi:23S rRNA (pseudouridine(1915)-N(3))-methyltransferase RlmH [Mesomycoplasma lagogenitalium]|uniref:Ribosomal RNA large subunit methyltransferase H n=1 Tax=Mesomycoplasma lagogenitalium TaxID=171286 RepID=A0ABY8LWJ0_9BACT|nr:23S rRNA (pseudouridine(1915)-N(3))-methyltransferase RlmH [Mesomycoplasma lagogenitalium]WGI36663.1 23S rRNA (pseudouridine(1915)-N(3))-methyltransferase RlmH [Mesomycoplasma lagogenitalium]